MRRHELFSDARRNLLALCLSVENNGQQCVSIYKLLFPYKSHSIVEEEVSLHLKPCSKCRKPRVVHFITLECNITTVKSKCTLIT